MARNRRFVQCCACLAAACLFVVNARTIGAAERAGELTPLMAYQAERSSPVTYDVDSSIIVTAPYKTKLLKVWLPLPPSDFGQQVEGREISTFPTSVEPRIGREPLFGNEFAYFEFAAPQGAQIVRHKFRVKAWQLNWRLDPAKVRLPDQWPAAFTPYLRSESQAIVIDEQSRKVLASIVPIRSQPYKDFGDVLDWVHGNLKYDHVNASLQASAVHALTNRAGHCSDYHGLCAAFGRALGFPTRVTYGINTFPKSSPSHCKLEAFLPPYGWVSFDVSETQRMISDIGKDASLGEARKKALASAARSRLLSGFRDNSWYLQTRGTDYDLVPPAKKRAAVVRTIYAEADGVALADPDPSNETQRQFAWMTAHSFHPDRNVSYPFKDVETLQVR